MTMFEKLNQQFEFQNAQKAKTRIMRYQKKYPTKDILKFAQRVKTDENIENAREAIKNELNLKSMNDSLLKTKLEEIVDDKKFVSDYFYKKNDSYQKLLKYLKQKPKLQLHNEDFRKVKIEANSIDVIVTDPPYPREFLDLYRDLAAFAERVLKPGGSLFAMAGQSYLPEIMKLMNMEGINYNWTLCYLTPGGQSPQIWQRKVNAFWKPVLWYIKGKPSKWLGDVVRSDVNDNDKNFHFWGQSISGMTDLVKRVSYPGETVLDPFMGGGATGAASLYNLRNFIGIEINENSFSIAKERLETIDISKPNDF